MDVDRDRFLLFFTAIAACHAPARNVAVEATLPTPPAPAPPNPCGALVAANQRVLGSPTLECARSDPNDTRDREAETKTLLQELDKEAALPFVRYCRVGHGGAWAVELLASKLTAPTGESSSCEIEVSYQLVFLGPGTRRRAYKRASWVSGPDDKVDPPDVHAQFDFDGDGQDELVVKYNEWHNGGGGDVAVDVLRATPAGVEPYPVGFSFDGVIDADGDGRPDLVDSSYFRAEDPCMGLYVTYRYGVPLLVHALPGGKFTMSDEVSRKWAHHRCATLAKDDEAGAASCKRLRGVPVAQITKAYSPAPQCGSSEKEAMTKLVTPPPPFAPLTEP